MELLYNFTWFDLLAILGVIMGIFTYLNPNLKKEETEGGRLYVKQLNIKVIIGAIISSIYLLIKSWVMFSHHFLE